MLLALFAGALAAAPHVIVSPDWVARPTGADLSELYPPEAARSGLSGRVLLACGVDAEGALQACSVERETPPGQGFGVAALAMATKFRMKPLSLDGAPVAGGHVRIPIVFQPAPPAAVNIYPPVDADGRPCPAQVKRYYPLKAQRAGIDGHVVLNCDITGLRPADCRVVTEEPAGFGFASSAVTMAQCLFTSSKTGEPRRNIPVNFKLPPR